MLRKYEMDSMIFLLKDTIAALGQTVLDTVECTTLGTLHSEDRDRILAMRSTTYRLKERFETMIEDLEKEILLIYEKIEDQKQIIAIMK